MVDDFIANLAKKFSLKDHGLLSYFLDIKVIPNDKGLILSQRRYIFKLLTKTKMLDAKSVLTPLPTNPLLTLHYGTSLFYTFKYRAIVGNFQYLLITK